MKQIVLVVLLLSMFGFSGCSLKSIQDLGSIITFEDSSEDEEMLDEFEKEFQVEEVYDPFNGYNRAMTRFNDVVYSNILTPTAKGYEYMLHEEIRESVYKFFKNLYYPTRVFNNLLQTKFYYSWEETERFIINSTIGLAGLFDPASSYFKIEAHEEDFGQTLGFYGVGAGPHIVLPIWGPSNMRDAISLVGDAYTSPLFYNERGYALSNSYAGFFAIKTFQIINEVSLDSDKYENIKKDAVDLYPYIRDIYEQHRQKLIEE